VLSLKNFWSQKKKSGAVKKTGGKKKFSNFQFSNLHFLYFTYLSITPPLAHPKKNRTHTQGLECALEKNLDNK
jgi:hypothetical protein